MIRFTRTNITTGETYTAAFDATHHEVFQGKQEFYGKRTTLLKAKELVTRWNSTQRMWRYAVCESK
jgi:hypothetical protein